MTGRQRRQVNGYIWNQEAARVERSHEAIRQLIAKALNEIEERPVSVQVLAVYLARMGVALNEATAGMQELQRIATADYTDDAD